MPTTTGPRGPKASPAKAGQAAVVASAPVAADQWKASPALSPQAQGAGETAENRADGESLAKRQAVAAMVRRSLRTISRQPAARQGIKGMGQQRKLAKSPWLDQQAPIVGPPPRPSGLMQSVQNTALWKSITSLPERYPVLGMATKLLAPVGALLNLRSSWKATAESLKDPSSSSFTRKGMVASTALAGVSAVAASGVGATALGFLPAARGLMGWGTYLASATGLASGAMLVAVDAVQSFRSPDAGPGEKLLATLATGSSVGLTVLAVAGQGGVVGFILGAGAVGFSLAKAWAPEAQWASRLGEAVGFKGPKAAKPSPMVPAKA